MVYILLSYYHQEVVIVQPLLLIIHSHQSVLCDIYVSSRGLGFQWKVCIAQWSLYSGIMSSPFENVPVQEFV